MTQTYQINVSRITSGRGSGCLLWQSSILTMRRADFCPPDPIAGIQQVFRQNEAIAQLGAGIRSAIQTAFPLGHQDQVDAGAHGVYDFLSGWIDTRLEDVSGQQRQSSNHHDISSGTKKRRLDHMEVTIYTPAAASSSRLSHRTTGAIAGQTAMAQLPRSMDVVRPMQAPISDHNDMGLDSAFVHVGYPIPGLGDQALATPGPGQYDLGYPTPRPCATCLSWVCNCSFLWQQPPGPT